MEEPQRTSNIHSKTVPIVCWDSRHGSFLYYDVLGTLIFPLFLPEHQYPPYKPQRK